MRPVKNMKAAGEDNARALQPGSLGLNPGAAMSWGECNAGESPLSAEPQFLPL